MSRHRAIYLTARTELSISVRGMVMIGTPHDALVDVRRVNSSSAPHPTAASKAMTAVASIWLGFVN